MEMIELLNRFEEFIKLVPAHADIEYNGKRTTIQSYYWAMKKNIESLLEELQEEKACLCVPLIKEFYDKTIPCIKVPITRVLNGEVKYEVDLLKNIQQGIADFHYEDYMSLIMDKLGVLMDRCGFHYAKELLGEYEKGSNIMVSAIRKRRDIEKDAACLKQGKTKKESPVIYNQAVEVRSAYQFYQDLQGIENNCILIGCLRPTVGDASDGIYEEFYGYPEEVVRNYAKNEDVSYEEAKKLYHIGKGSILIGIKNGENIWVYYDSSFEIASTENFYLYDGIRTSYMPIQLLFNEAVPSQMPDKNEVILFRKGWMLRDVLDEEQALFMSMLFLELNEKFFQEEAPVKSPVYFYENLVLLEEKPEDERQLPANSVPVNTLFKEVGEKQERVLKELGIERTECLQKELLIPTGIYATVDEAVSTLEERADWLLAAKAKRSFVELIKGSELSNDYSWNASHPKYFDWLIQHLQKDTERLLKDCAAFTWVHIHNEPLITLDGKIKKERTNSMWDRTVGETSRSDLYSYDTLPVLFTETASRTNRPSVKFCIIPKTAEDIMTMTGAAYEELPVCYRLYDFLCEEKFLGKKIIERPRTVMVKVCSNKKDLKRIQKDIV